MENTDSYPVFHTRLQRTYRRRHLDGNGRPAGWLIVNAVDSFYEVPVDAFADVLGDAADVLDDLDVLSVHDTPRPPIPTQLRRVPGAHCPIPGCPHHHGDDDPPQSAIPSPR